jgi:CHAT domain-containing protein/tetratricopeptide (TPR) repeat protein
LDNYFYTSVLRFSERGDREGLLNIINLDPLRARRVLIRLLRDPAKLEFAESFALLFSLSCESELECPLLDYFSHADAASRPALLDRVAAVTEAEFSLDRFETNDKVNREAWNKALADLETGAEGFRSIGFELGQAYCLSRLGYIYTCDTRPLNTKLSALEKALPIFEKLGDARGQARCLGRFARNYFKEGNAPRAEEYKRRALDKAAAAGDDVLQAYLLFYGLSGLRVKERPKAAAKAWALIEKNEGLRSYKYFLLGERADFDRLRGMLAQEPDILLKIRGTWLLSAYQKNIPDRLKYLDQAIKLAESLPRQIWPWEESEWPVPILPSLLKERADMNGDLGRLNEAIDDLGRALALLEEPSRPDEANDIERQKGDVHWQLSYLWKLRGDSPVAVEEAEKALQISRKTGNPWETIWSCEALSEVYADLGDFARAEQYLRTASQEPDPFFNPSDIFLAELHLGFERSEEALQDLNRAEDAFRREGPGAENLSGTWMSLCRHLEAAVWLRLGNPSNALEAARAAEKIHSMFLGMEVYDYFTPTGLVLAEMKRYPEAEEYFSKRLTLARERSYRLGEAEALKNLGKIFRAQGRRAEAIPSLLQALEIFQVLGYPRRALETYLELAQIAQEKNDVLAATNYFQKALRLAEELEQPKGIWSANYGLGQIARTAGDNTRAIAFFKTAVGAVESVAGRIKAELHKSSFLEDKITIYDELIQRLALSDVDEAFFYSERRRAQAFLELSQKSSLSISSSAAPPLLSQNRKLENRLIGKQKALLEQLSKPAEERDDKFISSLREELKSIREEHTQILNSLELSDPREAFRQGSLTPMTAKRVQQEILKPGQILVEYVVTDRDVMAFVVDKTHCRFFRLPVERPQLVRQIDQWRLPFRQLKEGRVDLLHLPYDIRLAEQIYGEVFQPLEQAIGGAERVVIVPDDVLFYLSFESLARSANRVQAEPGLRYGEYRNVDWLLRHYTVSYALSATSLSPQLRPARPAPKQLVAFGDPAVAVFAKSELGRTVLRAFEIDPADPFLPPLPFSAKEASLVAGLMGSPEPSKVLLGKEASEGAFLKEGPSAGYLHFAVHSMMNDEQPYYSGLVLSPEKDTDGLLQSFEILRTPLHCRLVTLSACETALGKLLKGEGMLSLARAFLLAGSTSIVVTLWSIEDSTMDVMAVFYEKLSLGQPLSAALRTAKLHCLDKTVTLGANQRLSFSHPFFWAPFILTETLIE